MKIGIRTKIIIYTIMILTIFFGIINSISIYIYKNEYTKVFISNAYIIGENLKYQLDELIKSGISLDNLVGFENQCKDMVEKYDNISYAVVINREGKILFHSDKSQHGKNIFNSNKNYDVDLFINKSNIILNNKVKYHHINIPITDLHNNYIASIGIGFPEKKIIDKTRNLIYISLIITLISLLIVILFLYIILSLQIINPLTKLINFTNEIRAQKILNKKIKINSGDEIGQLAFSFNNMIKELYKTTISKDFLNNIFNNMLDILIILDNNNKIKMLNKTAIDILGYNKKSIYNKQITDFINLKKIPDNLKNINDLINRGKIRNAEIYYRTKSKKEIPVLFSSKIIKSNKINNIICVAVDLRKQKESKEKISIMNKQLLDISHKAGMAEVTTGMMHNIGNILNSINISADKVESLMGGAKIDGLVKASLMLIENKKNIGDYLLNDSKGKLLPDYYISISKNLQECSFIAQEELKNLKKKIKMIKDFIETQHRYAYFNKIFENLDLITVIEDALKIQNEHFIKYNIKIIKKYSLDNKIKVNIQKSKMIFILLNIFSNAIESMINSHHKNRILTLNIIEGKNKNKSIAISDNGEGIEKKNLIRIFNHGFSTKEKGHGFGLHTCANYMKEMGGNIIAKSNGINKGATFILNI